VSTSIADYRDHVGASPTKFYKTTLFRGDHLMIGLNCLEPGQVQPVHDHADQDKVYVVLEGTGHFTVDETEQDAAPGQVVWAPAGAPHGVRNDGQTRLVVLIGMAPPPHDPAPPQSAPAWILQRRSIRAYTAAPVSNQQVQTLLEAAMAAPSGHDIRPWAFVVVRDPARRQALADIHRWGSMCAHAPVVVAVLGDPGRSEHWVADCSAATENLLLAAAGLGLGAVWVGVYPDEEREAAVRAVLNAPKPWRVLCLLPVGHPAEDKAPRTRYEAGKVHVEQFGNGIANA